MGGDPAQGRADRRAGGRAAYRGRVDPRHPPRGRRPRARQGRRPAGRRPVPAGRASAASTSSTTAPRWWSSTSTSSTRCGSTTCWRRCRPWRSSSPTAAASRRPTTTTRPSSSRIIRDEIGQGEGANLVIGRHYRAVVADWSAERALSVFRRLLERERGAYWTFCFFTGDRFLIGASPERHVSVRDQDVRMNPISGTFRVGGDLETPQAAPPRLPRRREGDLRALHGRRRGAQDDVRHLPRGRAGARPVPQADDPPRAHRVPPRRPQRARPARDPAGHDVRRHGHRRARRERLPADRRVRDRGARLLRRRARALRPRRRGPPHDGQPDPHPHRRRRPRRPPQGHGRCHPRARLRRGVRGGGDARQGGRHPRRLRARPAGHGARGGDRRADPRRGRPARARHPQPAAEPLLAHRPGGRAAGPVAGRPDAR